jgi:subtilisin family serine protease
MSERRASRRRMPAPAALAAAMAIAAALAVAAGPGAGVASAAPGRPGGPGTTDEVGSYIVVLDDGVASPSAVATDHGAMGAQVERVYRHALRGYSAELTRAEVGRLRSDRRVAFVERDRTLQVAVQTVPTGIRRTFADRNAVMDTDGQDDVRIDADVAVIDTGVASHPDLNVVARADCSFGFTCFGGLGSDGNGHGTHVAGTIGAIDNGDGVVGVAPGARIHSVRVCGITGSCSLSAIIAGVDYVTARAGTIEVANMSLGGQGSSAALSQAITRSVDAGVVNVVAAGNSAANAGSFFPANHPDVVAVSALADSDGAPGGTGGAPSCRPQSRDDRLADFSNFGQVVDMAAPGVCILSTWRDGGYRTISGTSMASPHVAGAAAVLARGAGSPANRAGVMALRQRLLAASNLGWVDTSGDGVTEPLLDAGRLG